VLNRVATSWQPGPTIGKHPSLVQGPELQSLRLRLPGLEHSQLGYAHTRLHKRYRNLTAAGKNKQKTMTALGRELLGFIWAIGIKVESNHGYQIQMAA
jgi:hypothetical protein